MLKVFNKSKTFSFFTIFRQLLKLDILSKYYFIKLLKCNKNLLKMLKILVHKLTLTLSVVHHSRGCSRDFYELHCKKCYWPGYIYSELHKIFVADCYYIIVEINTTVFLTLIDAVDDEVHTGDRRCDIWHWERDHSQQCGHYTQIMWPACHCYQNRPLYQHRCRHFLSLWTW